VNGPVAVAPISITSISSVERFSRRRQTTSVTVFGGRYASKAAAATAQRLPDQEYPAFDERMHGLDDEERVSAVVRTSQSTSVSRSAISPTKDTTRSFTSSRPIGGIGR